MSENQILRKCCYCKIKQTLDAFNNDKTRLHGKGYICRECGSKKDKERYSANIEKSRARGIAYYWKTAERQKKLRVERYRANLDASRAENRDFYARNADKRRAERRAYYWNDPAKNQAITKRWAQQNPEKVKGGNKIRNDRVDAATPPWLTEEQR